MIPSSAKTLKNHLLGWCPSNYIVLGEQVIKITSLVPTVHDTLRFKSICHLRHYTTVKYFNHLKEKENFASSSVSPKRCQDTQAARSHSV